MLVKLGIQWISLSDLIVTSTGTSYKLQVREGHTLFYSIGETVPDSNEGYVVTSGESFDYTVTEGKDLYLRSGDVSLVNISETSGSGGIQPTGTINITENGVYNVTNYASADVQVVGGETVTAINGTEHPITEGEFVRFKEVWDSEQSVTINTIVDGGYQAVNETFKSGRALEDIAAGESGSIETTSATLYYSNLAVDVTPNTATIQYAYVNKYDGSNWTESGVDVDVPYYTNVSLKITEQGYKPVNDTVLVQNQDITESYVLEASTPVFIYSVPNELTYYLADDLDNISFSSYSFPATPNCTVVGDGANLFVGSTGSDYYYSTDAKNWTAQDVQTTYGQIFTVCNGDVYMNSQDWDSYFKMTGTTTAAQIGNKTSASTLLVSGGFDDFEFASEGSYLTAGYEAYPDFTFNSPTIMANNYSNIVEKWNKAWFAICNQSSGYFELYNLEDIEGSFTKVAFDLYVGVCHPFIVDAGNNLMGFFSNGSGENTIWVWGNDGIVTKKNMPSNASYCLGAVNYNGTVYALFYVTDTVVLYKTTDEGTSWTSVDSTSITLPNYSYTLGNLLTIGYV